MRKTARGLYAPIILWAILLILVSGGFIGEMRASAAPGGPGGPNNAAINYNLNGGTNPIGAPTTYVEGTGVTLPIPTKAGSTFAGWYSNAAFTGSVVTAIGTSERGAQNFWAKWTVNVVTYNITYHLNSGTNPVGAPTTYTFGVGATLPTPTRTNYTFGGWFDNVGLAGSATTAISTSATGDREFWAKWTANAVTYNITYHLNSGTNPVGAPTTYTFGVGATLPTPTRANYTFGGWFDNVGLAGSATTAISTSATGDREFWAKWTANEYVITYHLNSGTNPVGAPTTYVFGVGATLPTPTRTNYTFGGWFDNSSLTGSAITAISTSATGDKEFWAKWTANEYVITYHLNSGTNPVGAPTTYVFGVGATLPTPTRTNYTFGGWFDNVGLAGSATTAISTSATGDREFWAKWTAKSNDDEDTTEAGGTLPDTSTPWYDVLAIGIVFAGIGTFELSMVGKK